MANYFYQSDKTPVGPIDLLEMERLVRSDLITPKTRVCYVGDQEWRFAEQLPEIGSLFSGVMPFIQEDAKPENPLMGICPCCKNEVSIDALICPKCGKKLKEEQSAVGLMAAIIIGLIIGGFVFSMIMSLAH